jgi:general secretion pathway protein C
MASRLAAMIVWAAAAASAVFWGYRLFVKALPVPPQAALVETGVPPVGGDLTRLFGAPAAEALAAEEAVPPADARFKLVGVVAPGRGQRGGLALISVDGKAPRAVGIGGMVEGDLALVSVSHRRVHGAGTAGAAGSHTRHLGRGRGRHRAADARSAACREPGGAARSWSHRRPPGCAGWLSARARGAEPCGSEPCPRHERAPGALRGHAPSARRAFEYPVAYLRVPVAGPPRRLSRYARSRRHRLPARATAVTVPDPRRRPAR